MLTENEIARIVVDCSFKIHKTLGPGLLESAYEECLFYEMPKRGLSVEKEKPLPLVYESVKLQIGYRVDFLVEHKVIIDVKSIEALADIHIAQVLTYLKLSGCKLGLLINFNVPLIKDGIKRRFVPIWKDLRMDPRYDELMDGVGLRFSPRPQAGTH
jgi:GxxExxY protein